MAATPHTTSRAPLTAAGSSEGVPEGEDDLSVGKMARSYELLSQMRRTL